MITFAAIDLFYNTHLPLFGYTREYKNVRLTMSRRQHEEFLYAWNTKAQDILKRDGCRVNANGELWLLVNVLDLTKSFISAYGQTKADNIMTVVLACSAVRCLDSFRDFVGGGVLPRMWP